jgi:hypothetical protein
MIVVASFSGSGSQSHYCHSKRRNIPEGSNTQQDLCKNLKPHTSQHSTADALVVAQQEETFTYLSFAKSEVLPSAVLKITVSWDVLRCILVDILAFRRYRPPFLSLSFPFFYVRDCVLSFI